MPACRAVYYVPKQNSSRSGQSLPPTNQTIYPTQYKILSFNYNIRASLLHLVGSSVITHLWHASTKHYNGDFRIFWSKNTPYVHSYSPVTDASSRGGAYANQHAAHTFLQRLDICYHLQRLTMSGMVRSSLWISSRPGTTLDCPPCPRPRLSVDAGDECGLLSCHR